LERKEVARSTQGGGSWRTDSKNSDGVDSQLVKLAVTHDGGGVECAVDDAMDLLLVV
jgi:hypothetical protein